MTEREGSKPEDEAGPGISRRQAIGLGLTGGIAAGIGFAGHERPLFAAAEAAPGVEAQKPGYVSVADYGAVPNVRTKKQAEANTAAFRKAFASSLSDYRKLKAPIEVYVPAGRWYLSDGFAVPLGCALRGAGCGATYLVIPEEVTPKPANPVVSLGGAFDDSGKRVLPGTEAGHYAAPGLKDGETLLPACVIDGVFIVTFGVGIETLNPGWIVQNVWLIARIGILMRGDGILTNVVVDWSSLNGLVFEGGQNVLASNIYIFGTNFGITFNGRPSNDPSGPADKQLVNNGIRFQNTQIVYTHYCPILFAQYSINNNISFDGLSILYNEAPGKTFLSSVYFYCLQTGVTFSNALFSNQPGYALRIGLLGDRDRVTLNNCLFDGAPSNPVYNDNRAQSGGIQAGNLNLLEMNGCHFRNLGQPALTFGGDFGPAASLIWNGGVIQDCEGVPLKIAFAGRGMDVALANVISLDPRPLLDYSANDGGKVHARFVNCSSKDPESDIVFRSQGAPAAFATRVSGA